MTRAFAIALLTAVLASSGHAFDLQGHRGARGLAPENTLAAFEVALSVGVSTLELDLGMTRDGVLVVHHDARLNPDLTREPDGKFLEAPGPPIHSLTLTELKRFDVGRIKPGTSYAKTFSEQKAVEGARIPTLAEVFDLVRAAGAGHVRFNIETKLTPASGSSTPDPESFAAAVTRQVRAAGLADRVTVQSFDWRTLAVARRIAPEIARVCLTVEGGSSDNLERGRPGASPWTAGLDIDDFDGSAARLVTAAGCSVWSPNFRNLTAHGLTEARSLVNEPADMTRLIALGVDGIITDYPNRLRAVMTGRNMPLPPTVPAR